MNKKNLYMFGLSLATLFGSCKVAHVTDYKSDAETVSEPSHEVTGKKDDQVSSFVLETGNDIIKILADKSHSLETRKAEFEKVLLKYFNMPKIGEFVIGGKYWREMTAMQRTEYIKLFEKAVIENYASKFNSYNNQKLEVKNTVNEPQDNQVRVFSNIVQPNGKIFHKIEWIVDHSNNKFQVLDLRIEGISMRLTMRTDYTGVYRRGGFEALKTYLEGKISKAKTASTNQD